MLLFKFAVMNRLLPPLLLLILAQSDVLDAQCSRRMRRPTTGNVPHNPELQMTSSEIIRSRGYPVEEHSVVTQDGYVLQVNRIPALSSSSSNKTTTARGNKPPRVVYLMYGYMGTDAIWSIPPANRSLAYILADKGYDVWMGNSRGNTYSRRHLWMDPQDRDYWNFSWDEMGRYDIPASINYILKVTQQKRLTYIGNSFANTLFFIAASTNRDINKKVELMIALAPVAAVTRTKSSMLRYVMLPVLNRAKALARRNVAWIDNGASQRDPLRTFQRLICEMDYVGASLCRDMLFSITGSNTDNFDLNAIPGINTYIPAGISFNSLAQFGQKPPPGEYLAAFDYGHEENMRRYGTPQSPAYNLKLVTAPVHIFYGQNDLLTPPEDIQLLAQQLGNVKSVTQVSDPCFNHFDFLFGVNANEVLYRKVFSLMPPAY